MVDLDSEMAWVVLISVLVGLPFAILAAHLDPRRHVSTPPPAGKALGEEAGMRRASAGFAFIGFVGLLAFAIIGGTIWHAASKAPSPPPPSFDVMLDSASPDLKTHPCATDPARSCFTMQVRSFP